MLASSISFIPCPRKLSWEQIIMAAYVYPVLDHAGKNSYLIQFLKYAMLFQSF